MAPSEGRGGAATKPPPPGGGRLASLAAVSRPPMLVEHVEHARVGGDIELAREVRARGEQPVVVLARQRVRMGGAVREGREAAVVLLDDERRVAEQHAGEERLAGDRDAGGGAHQAAVPGGGQHGPYAGAAERR